MRFRLFALLAVCLCAFLFSQPAYGQATGSFSGTVVDKSGAAIQGATVTVTSQSTGVARQSKTDEVGHYTVPFLPATVFTVRVEFQGFQSVESKDVRLQVDEARVLDFTLAPSTQSAQVEVLASAVAVETTNPSLGQVITAQEVSQLPLNGRDFVQLATLTPGTVQETNTNSFFNGAPSSEVSARGTYSLSVGGSRANSTDWLLDGNDNNELTAGGIGIFSSIDDIQEFKVLTYNYSAEYGERAGPTVLVTTKSGTNDFHGSLFEFFRNTSLDAKSFFATTAEKFNLNQFGGSVGGPIRKNKTFFFVDGEQKDQLHGVTFTGLVPTDAMKAGDFSKDAFGNPVTGTVIANPNVGGAPFQCDASGAPEPLNGATLANPAGNGSQTGGSPCNKIPAGLVNPLATKLMAFYPEPNANNPSTNTNFINEPVRSLYETKIDGRIDHSFSNSDNAFARFSYDQATSYVPGGGGVNNFTESNFFASNQGIINHARNIALSETHVFSPTTINQVTGGYNRIFDYITSQGTSSCESAKLGIPNANLNCTTGNTCVKSGVSCGLTISEVLGNYFSIGDRGFSPFQGGTNIFSIADTLDMIRGKHDIKVGGSVRANQMNVKTEGFQDGFYEFTGLWTANFNTTPNIGGNPEADLLLGLSSLAIHDQTFKGPTTGRRWKVFRPFVQDDWRIRNDLTVNIGLAWNLTTPISEVDNRQADFNPATGTFLVPGVVGVGKWAGIQFDKNALEPRIGLAWKPRGSAKTAVRAGYAIYHDSSWNQGAQGLWQNPPYYDETDAFAFGGACTFAAAACFTPTAPNATGISIFPTAFSGGAGGFPQGAVPSQPNFTDFTGTILAQNTNFKLGMIQQFNASVEHELPGQIVVTAGYIGSRSSHVLVDGNNINVVSPAACFPATAVSGYTLGCLPGGGPYESPYLTNFPFSDIAATEDVGRSHYNGLQIKAETKSARHGIYALIGYTYSRTYDTGFADGLGTNVTASYFPLPNWRKLDWALSDINLDNNFTASVVYDLPFGQGKKWGSDWSKPVNNILGNWQVTVIEHISSGFPVAIVDSNTFGVFPSQLPNGNFISATLLNGNIVELIRPNAVQGCNPNAGPHTVAEWFNTACFSAPGQGELGNANRAPVIGPDFVNTDFSLIKQFKLPWENIGLNFRAEFFNLWNHAQFAAPNSTSSLATPDFAGAGFGSISATVNNPRLVQFGLKLTF